MALQAEIELFQNEVVCNIVRLPSDGWIKTKENMARIPTENVQ